MDRTQVFKDPRSVWDHLDVAMVRDPAQYAYTAAPERHALPKLQLGAGFKQLDGWRNLEYPDWDADQPIPAPSESVGEIASYHTLDHLSPAQVIGTLREIERVLVPGGVFTNIVPHADSQLAKECIHHQTRFMVDTWRNIFSERQYAHDGEWNLEVGLNFIFGLAERNVVLVTQLIKK